MCYLHFVRSPPRKRSELICLLNALDAYQSHIRSIEAIRRICCYLLCKLCHGFIRFECPHSLSSKGHSLFLPIRFAHFAMQTSFLRRNTYAIVKHFSNSPCIEHRRKSHAICYFRIVHVAFLQQINQNVNTTTYARSI